MVVFYFDIVHNLSRIQWSGAGVEMGDEIRAE